MLVQGCTARQPAPNERTLATGHPVTTADGIPFEREWGLISLGDISAAPRNLGVRIWSNPSGEGADGVAKCPPQVIEHFVPTRMEINAQPVGRVRFLLKKASDGGVSMIPEVQQYVRTAEGEQIAAYENWTPVETADGFAQRHVTLYRERISEVPYHQQEHIMFILSEFASDSDGEPGTTRVGTVFVSSFDTQCIRLGRDRSCIEIARCAFDVGWAPLSGRRTQ